MTPNNSNPTITAINCTQIREEIFKMKSRFIIYLKKSEKDNPKKSDNIFYARYVNPIDTSKTVRRSIDDLNVALGNRREHIKEKERAYMIADEALKNGLIFSFSNNPRIDDNSTISEKQETIPLVPKNATTPYFKAYIREFWNYDTSPYVKKVLINGGKITKSHCNNQLCVFNKNCSPLIPDELKLDEFTVSLMEKIKASMFDKGMSSSSISLAINAISKPLKEAYKIGLIDEDITARFTRVRTSINKERGILTRDETEKLFSFLNTTYKPDTYERWIYLFIRLAYETGMREGEIQVLKKENFTIKDDEITFIKVSNAWNEIDGLKDTKTHQERTVTASTALCREILDYSNWNEGGLIFASYRVPDRPINKTTINGNFKKALTAIGISEKERKERNITMYSSRHFFNTAMQNEGIGLSDLQRVTGHKTLEMTQHYTHETEEALIRQAKIREKAIPTGKKEKS